MDIKPTGPNVVIQPEPTCEAILIDPKKATYYDVPPQPDHLRVDIQPIQPAHNRNEVPPNPSPLMLSDVPPSPWVKAEIVPPDPNRVSDPWPPGETEGFPPGPYRSDTLPPGPYRAA